MAFNAKSGCMRRIRTASLAAVLGCLPLLGQTHLSLVDLGARTLPDYTPAHRGEHVIVRGSVAAPAFYFPDYSILAIQDSSAGAALQASKGDSRLDAFSPGDSLEAEGFVENLAGMPIVVIIRVEKTGTGKPPKPIDVKYRDLVAYPRALGYLGRLVRVQGEVSETAPTAAGGQILLGSADASYKFFLPSTSAQPDLSGIRQGDTISAIGIAFQYCPVPPQNRFFELLVNQRANIAVVASSRAFNPLGLALALSVVLFISFFLWSRERRLRKQRERLRRTYQLAEEILSASTPGAILERISEVLPSILGITRVRLHLHNRAAATLETASTGKEDSVSVSLATSEAGAQAGAVACFHYRTLLVIPDTGRSPFPIVSDAKGKIPKSMMLVPMIAQSEVMGVLELDQDNRFRDFKPEEQAIAQHLANQIGVAIRLLDQRSVQEQLFRTEKMAAVGRLISGVVNELKVPLASIQEIAEKTIAREQAAQTSRELSAIVSELRNAKAMVDRLVAFGSDTPSGVHPVCVPALLRRLIRFREGDSRASGIKINDLTSHEDLTVQGSEGQLEQVFLNLLVHAEQSVTEAPQKCVTVRTSVLAGRLVVEVAFTAILEPSKMEDTASVLSLARGIVAGHGGEARLITKTGQDPRFEVELPLAVRERAPASSSTAAASRDSSKVATTLLIEPDDAAQKQLLQFLSARGCRVVPMGNADAALELSHRIRFDAAFCSLHAPGLNWVELSERMQNRVGVFVLLSDGYDPELNADFEGEGRFVLAKPVQETELDRILKNFASHATV